MTKLHSNPRRGRHVSKAEATLPFLGQQLLDTLAENLVAVVALPLQLAIPPVPGVALLINQVDAWPHGVTPAVPILLVVIDENGEIQFL